jgi:hypothetical protein
VLANLAVGVIGQVIGLFGERGKAQQEALKARVEAMQRSGTDEIITAVWFSPAVVAWFSPERAEAWIERIFNTSPEYTALLIGITAAVFGLGKINGRVKQ